MMAYSDPTSARGKSVPRLAGPSVQTEKKPRVLVAACGCVAAAKFGIICSSLIEWADVKAIVTKSSLRFVDEGSIPKDVIVFCDDHEWLHWNSLGDDVLHIALAQWADMFLIAPLSAHTLAKIAGGLCDNLLTSVVRAWDYNKPFFVAPCMNKSMWRNPVTEKQCMSIDELGINLIPPGERDCAMAEPVIIYSTVRLYYDKNILKKEAGLV